MYYSVEKRNFVISEKQSGKSLIEISDEQGISYSTVKRIWKAYQTKGESGLNLNYQNCGPKQPKFYRIFRLSTWLKRSHPNWGAPYILTLLEERYPKEGLPTVRTLQKWFRVKGMNKTYLIREKQKVTSVQEVHDCWQIDAKEKIKLGDESKACYLTTVDVKSGAVLETPIFPCGNISQVSPREIQEYLIRAFLKWGMPKSIRVDNGMPLGDPQRKSLPLLCLWLEAMGVQVIFNRPRRPTDNAKVERMQRTTKNWAEVYACKNTYQLQQQLEKVCLIQREKFKVSRLGGKTRKEYYPELFNNPRVYELGDFEPKKAFERLEKWTFSRKASKTGQFSLYGNVYYLGTKFSKQYVSIKFVYHTTQWKVSDSMGNHIKNFDAINFDQDHLWNLTISQRTNKNKKVQT